MRKNVSCKICETFCYDACWRWTSFQEGNGKFQQQLFFLSHRWTWQEMMFSLYGGLFSFDTWWHCLHRYIVLFLSFQCPSQMHLIVSLGRSILSKIPKSLGTERQKLERLSVCVQLDVLYPDASHPLFLLNTNFSCLPRPLRSKCQYPLYSGP